MPTKFPALIAAVASFLFLPVSAGAAPGQERVALVIGNGAYQSVAPLPNPINDAAAIAQMFKEAGFSSVTMKRDLGVLEFKRALRDFFYATRDADVAVVYYAGHGMQVGDTSYMIPVDARLATEIDVQDEAVSLDRIVATLQPAKRLRLVILDACRNNPFVSRMKMSFASRSIERGLARIEPENNSLVAYAAKSGQIAEDGTGTHSPFTAALLKHLAEPGLDIRLALGRVRDDVLKSTSNKQEPFVYGSLGGDSVSLVPQAAEPSHEKLSDVKADIKLTDVKGDYELVERIGTQKAWEAFLSSHGEGLYADLARAQLAKLHQAENKADRIRPEVTLATQGEVARPQLATFSQPGTKDLRPEVAALLATQGTADVMRPADARPPVAREQPSKTLDPVLSAVLRQFGCVVSQTDPALGGALHDAIRRQLADMGRPDADIKVVESLLADLKVENDRLCAANAKPAAQPAERKPANAIARQPSAEDSRRTGKTNREEPQQLAAHPKPVRQESERVASRPAPKPTASSEASTVSLAQPSVIGVGF